MRQIWQIRGAGGILIGGLLLATLVWAETLELQTYYPSPPASNVPDPLYVDSAAIGSGYNPTSNPPLSDGVLLVERNLGIGTNAPNEQLEITGNFRLPPTTVAAGIIRSGADRYIHSFGSFNFFAGARAGNLTMTGSTNTAIGTDVLQGNTTGMQNTAVGAQALRSNTTGSENIAIGPVALLDNTTGSGNIAVGSEALQSNVFGTFNVAVGSAALESATNDNNTALGAFALQRNTAGSSNTAMGIRAGVTSTPANANSTGSNNTFIGADSGPGTATQLGNATALGANALVSASNALVLGGTGANAVNVGIGTRTPQAVLDIVREGGAIIVPRKTTAGDPAVGVNGMIYYSTVTNKFRGFQDGAWTNLGGGVSLKVFNGNLPRGVGGNDPAPIDTGISAITYPNAVAIFRGADQYDNDRMFWVEAKIINDKWHVDIEGDRKKNGANAAGVWYSLVAW